MVAAVDACRMRRACSCTWFSIEYVVRVRVCDRAALSSLSVSAPRPWYQRFCRGRLQLCVATAECTPGVTLVCLCHPAQAAGAFARTP